MYDRFITKTLYAFGLVLLNCIFLLMTGQEEKSSFIWMGLLATLFIVGLTFPIFRERAFGFLFLGSSMMYVGFLSYLDLALQLMMGQYWKNNLGPVLMTWLVCTIFLLLQVFVTMGRVQRGKKYLIDTKKLDIENSEWDLDKFLYLEDPQKLDKKMARVLRLRYLLPLGPALGYFLNRNLGANMAYFIVGLGCFVMAIIILAQIGLQIALGIGIREWEKEMGIQIRVKE